ncbi:MAG: putative porin [Aestuariibaculum sp.]
MPNRKNVFNMSGNKQSVLFLKITLMCFMAFQFSKLNAQNKLSREGEGRGTEKSQDSLSNAEKLKEQTKITDYLIISHANDTTYVDTTLTIQKDYKFNYLRKDDFELVPFSNMGQTYNQLSYNFKNTRLMPNFGARAKHFNYMEVEDINYYRVPTPLTELMYKTAFEQGQLADSFFTINLSPEFNFSIAYKGLRSLGKYQHILTSTGNFRFTTNYTSKNKRYEAKAHIVAQDILNEENGGIIDEHIEYFENGDEEYLDRSIFEVNFEDAESMLRGKRFYLDHSYALLRKNDSLSKNNIRIGHIMSFEDKYYQYDQSTARTAYFGDAFKSSGLQEKATLENFYNQFHLNYSNNIIGDLQFNISTNNYNYGYDKLVVLNGDVVIPNRLKGNIFAAGGKYHKQYKGLDLSGELGLNISGDFDGNYISAQASFKLADDVFASAGLNHSSKAPNYNTLLYQSNYVGYNWRNNLNNIKTQQLSFQVKYKKLVDVTVDYSTISDYVYFKREADTLQVKPYQNNGTITYLRAKLENELTFGKFALTNTLLYQNTQEAEGILNVPDFTTRNTISFSTHLFKKALFFQTGLTFKYFTKYYMDAYNPLLAEFYIQENDKYGGFPLFDYFLNVKIRQTRLYLKAEHFNTAFKKLATYNYYSAPNNPYRDFTVRFGVVWNFFL